MVIASRFPYPLEKGDKLRLYHQIKSLSAFYEVSLAAISDQDVLEEHLGEMQKYCTEVKVFKTHGPLNAMRSLLNRDAFQMSYFYSSPVHKKLQSFHDVLRPDVIYFQLFRTSKYSIESKAVKVMDLMDCFSYGYGMRSKESKGLKSLFYKLESKRIRANELALQNQFDAYTIISQQDAERIDLKNEIDIVPNGIDVEFFNNDRSLDQDYDLLFVGNLGYEPNVYAVNYLFEHIYPLTSQLGLKINISGARPGKQIKSYDRDDFKVFGWVDDIRDAYKRSKVFIAPIFGGIGQQNKVLEAMAMQLPCIVSPEVADGLGIEKVEDYLTIADSPNRFYDAIKEACIEELPIYQDKAIKSRKYLEEVRSWTAVNSELNQIFEKLLKQK